MPFAFANCPGLTSTTDPRFASCNYIPDNRISPISKALLDKLVLPTGPGITDNYYARDNFESTLHKIDTKLTWTPGNRLNMNGRRELAQEPREQPRHLSVAGWRGVQPAEHRPALAGHIMSRSLLATSILSQSFVVDGVFGYTPYHSFVGPEGPQDECWGDHFGIPSACQPPRSRDRETPKFTMRPRHGDPEPDPRLRRQPDAVGAPTRGGPKARTT